MQHDKPVKFKLVRAAIVNGKRETVTVQSDLTWEQAKAAKKLDRTLTAVREIEAAPTTAQEVAAMPLAGGYLK